MKEICPNLHNKQVAKEFGELEQLFGKTAASLLWSRNNGYSIDKAPNGADSILFRELLHVTNGDRIQALILKAKVYSDEFFKWFGNWEKSAKENPYSKDISIGSPEADFSNVDSTGTGVLIPIFLNGEYIGETGLDNALYHKDKGMSIKGKYMEMPSVGGSNITIEKEYRGKGYGKATYFELAKLAANNGKILRSAPDKSRTPASTRVWESLVRDGYAKRVNDRYEIINSTLNNASKVVDENGEPLVVYHNTPFEFNGIFDMDHKSRIMPWTSEPFGHVGTQETANKIKGTQFALFLNVKNPLETPDFVHETVNSMLSELYKQGIISKEKYSSLRGISNSELRNLMLSLGYDGTKYENKAEKGGVSYSFITPNQIKSAIGNSGEFSQYDDDIYKSAQGELNMGAAIRLSNIPRKGDISILQQYLKSHRNGVSSTALKLVMAAVNRYFNNKQTGITYEIVDNLQGGEAAHYDSANKVIRINKNASFRNESKSLTPEVQTIVHEMLHAVTEHAIRNDSRVRKSFEDLLQKTKKHLGKDAQYYGLKDVYEFVAELSNAQFVDKLKYIQYSRKQTLFERIKQVIKKIYYQIFTSYKDFIGSDTVYEAAVNDLFAVMSHNEQKEDNIVDNNADDVLKSIQASEEKVNKIHHRITELFQGLYKDYKKQLNKGANRQRREDQVWSTIQELKSQEKKESSRIAIQSALKTIGVFARDPIDNTILQARRNTILGFLQECQKNNFDSLTAEQIHDMKSNIIDFYNDLVKTLSDNQMDLDARDQADVDTLNATVRQISQLWKMLHKLQQIKQLTKMLISILTSPKKRKTK